MKFDMKRSSKIAVILYLLGLKYNVSSFEDFITYGYGELSDFGFWQYDLIEKRQKTDFIIRQKDDILDNRYQKEFIELNNNLIGHYQCFNTERFYLDDMERDFISIVSGIEDSCPIELCKGIAKYTNKQAIKLGLHPVFIYVGAWAIKTEKL